MRAWRRSRRAGVLPPRGALHLSVPPRLQPNAECSGMAERNAALLMPGVRRGLIRSPTAYVGVRVLIRCSIANPTKQGSPYQNPRLVDPEYRKLLILLVGAGRFEHRTPAPKLDGFPLYHSPDPKTSNNLGRPPSLRRHPFAYRIPDNNDTVLIRQPGYGRLSF